VEGVFGGGGRKKTLKIRVICTAEITMGAQAYRQQFIEAQSL